MKQPDPQTVEAFAQVARHNVLVKAFIKEWRDLECGRLPDVLNNTAVAQGRCQVLNELNKLISESPDLAAQARKG